MFERVRYSVETRYSLLQYFNTDTVFNVSAFTSWPVFIAREVQYSNYNIPRDTGPIFISGRSRECEDSLHNQTHRTSTRGRFWCSRSLQ